jgi:hypothetical protein
MHSHRMSHTHLPAQSRNDNSSVLLAVFAANEPELDLCENRSPAWIAVQRSRYMTLESIASIGDDPRVSLRNLTA